MPTDQEAHIGKHTYLSYSLLKEILMFDINNIYFTLGDRITQQIMGVPMGSPCSPALAIGLCMRAEHKHILQYGKSHIHAAFRYVDDLLLYMDPNFDTTIIDGIYPHPLELEVEKHNGNFRYLMTWNQLQDDGTLYTSYYHKNAHRHQEGKTPLKNITDFTSDTPLAHKFGRAIGDLHRICRHSLSTLFCLGDVHHSMNELVQQNMPKGLLKQAFSHFIQNPGATPIEQLLSVVPSC